MGERKMGGKKKRRKEKKKGEKGGSKMCHPSHLEKLMGEEWNRFGSTVDWLPEKNSCLKEKWICAKFSLIQWASQVAQFSFY